MLKRHISHDAVQKVPPIRELQKANCARRPCREHSLPWSLICMLINFFPIFSFSPFGPFCGCGNICEFLKFSFPSLLAITAVLSQCGKNCSELASASCAILKVVIHSLDQTLRLCCQWQPGFHPNLLLSIWKREPAGIFTSSEPSKTLLRCYYE